MKPIKKAIETIQTLGTENKQLKDELDLLRDDYDLQCQCRDGYRMENKRLGGVLEEIRDMKSCYGYELSDARDIARVALEGK